MDALFKKYALATCFGLAGLFLWIITANGLISSNVVPFCDGYHYALRAFTLYGYLHSGQWTRFCDYFTLPRTDDLAPLHYWLFFLLPKSCASVTTYGITIGLSTYLLLAIGICWICKVLEKPEWSVPLFVLCLWQNFSLNYTFFYYCDGPFYAACTVGMAAQMAAWKNDTPTTRICSGMTLGALFWIKPSNALLFSLFFAVAELIWTGQFLFPFYQAKNLLKGIARTVRQLGLMVAGFLVIAGPALFLGGAHVILMLLYSNEVSHHFNRPLECQGLLRFFYFPLCLSYFYNVALLLLIAGCVVAYRCLYVAPAAGEKLTSNTLRHLVPFMVAAFALGEFFSFGLHTKTIRCLLPILPAIWLGVFWAAEKARVRQGIILLAVAVYCACGTSQILWNAFSSKSRQTEIYQLNDDWYKRFPQPANTNFGQPETAKAFLSILHQDLPNGGKIALNTELFYANDYCFDWLDEQTDLLRGVRPLYSYSRLMDVEGAFDRNALVGTTGFLLLTTPEYQSSDATYRETWQTIKYAVQKWRPAHQVTMYPIEGMSQAHTRVIIGVIISLKSPLTNDQIDAWTEAAAMPESTNKPDPIEIELQNRITIAQAEEIINRWWSVF